MALAPPPALRTVTFFFTDVEASTRLWEQQSAAMRADLARHDTLLYQTIEAQGGHVFKTIGDAFCAAFPTTQAAVQAATAAQDTLHREVPQLRVRMAVHTGVAEERGGDYFGPALNRIARLLIAGHGGQILISQAAVDQLRESLPPEAQLLSMGEHRLRDLPDKERIYQLQLPGLPGRFPPLNTLDVAFRRGLVRASAIAMIFIVFVSALAFLALDQAHRAGRATARELRQRRLVEERLYAADMIEARRSWEDGNLQRTRDLLEAHRPRGEQEDRRGFEWRYLWRLCRGDERFTLRGHTGWVAVDFSPDGKALLSFSGDGTVKRWNLASRQVTATIKWPSSEPSWSMLLRLGRLATMRQDGRVRVRDLASGRELTTLKVPRTSFGNIEISPDGRVLAVAYDRTVELWDVPHRRKIASLKHRDPVGWLAFSPDSRSLAATGPAETNSVGIWNVVTRREVAVMEGAPPGADCIGFSPNGKILATGGYGGTVSLWDPAAKRQVAAFRAQKGRVIGLAFSPDGKTLAAGGDAPAIRLWDLTTKQERTILRGHTAGVPSLTFSPDGKTLASGSLDRTVKLWSLTPKPEAGSLQAHKKGISRIAFSPDGKLFASGSWDNTAKVWDLSTRRVIATLTSRGAGQRVTAFSPDGKLLAVGNTDSPGEVMLWDVQTRREIDKWSGYPDGIIGLAFSPDGKTLATGGGKGTVTLRDLASRRMETLAGHGDRVPWLAFSPDGRTLASASYDGTVKLWSLATRREVGRLTGHTRGIFAVVFSPDGRTVATASWDLTVRLWNLATRREVAKLSGSVPACGVAFSPDGKTLATGHLGESVKLWNLATGQEVISFAGPLGYAPVAFSPDGQLLASGSGPDDRSVLLWRAASFAETDAQLRAPKRRGSR
ncbi:MAG TPA: adenylate/guanylate cyclase domain-containing protein [Gemmatimonadales bacterium]|nr:adenylate/guanylate cyclase domain-containing protein [Gemmatimonadales bacterium]